MLTKKQVLEIRDHLSSAQNPVFLFDNDQDGLCSFLILQRFIGRGKGFPIKTSPALTLDLFRKVNEFDSDYIFVLDKPEVEEDFFKEAHERNIPVVWIDHHEIDREKIPPYVNYYNPLFNKKKTNEPVTALCYQIANKKEDNWIGVVGCVADHFVPEFYKDFTKKYPELCIKNELDVQAFDILYGSEIGKIARMIGFAMKDRVSNVVHMMKFLIEAKGPYDVLEDSSKNKIMHKRFYDIEKKYKKLIDKARQVEKKNEKVLFFKYSGDTSMSSDVANYLGYLFPKKFVVVIYAKGGGKANVSIRGEKAREIIEKIIPEFENATGGGHEKAVGAQIMIDDVGRFEKRVREIVG